MEEQTCYFGGENSVASDELRAKELVGRITQAAGSGNFTPEMAALVKELNEVKQRIAEKKQRRTATSTLEHRLAEVTEAVNRLKGQPIRYDDTIIRKLIECVRVLSPDEIEITFKGGTMQRVPMQS